MAFAKAEDQLELTALWKACFEDDDAFINKYFQSIFNPQDVCVIKQEGKIVAMSTLHNAILNVNGKAHKCLYVYAVATHPSYRSKGYFRELIEVAKKEQIKRHASCLVTVPATEKLFGLYEKNGFHASSFLYQEVFYKSEVDKGLSIYDLSQQEFIEMRESFLKTIDCHVELSIDATEFVYDYTKEYKGIVMAFCFENKQYYILGTQEAKSLVIKETNADYEVLSKIYNKLLTYFDQDVLIVHFSNQANVHLKKIPYAMSTMALESDLYMNLMLD